jgi:hypothetical protein
VPVAQRDGRGADGVAVDGGPRPRGLGVDRGPVRVRARVGLRDPPLGSGVQAWISLAEGEEARGELGELGGVSCRLGIFFVLKKAKRFNQSKLYLFFFLSLSCIPSLLLRFKLTSEIVATASLRASASCGVPRSLSAAKARREARAAPGAKQAARACDCFVVVDFDFLNEVG